MSTPVPSEHAGLAPRPIRAASTAVPVDSTTTVKELSAALGVVLMVVVSGAWLLWRDPSYFWNDDNQLYHTAGYFEVARAWREGEWPLLSRSNWQSGALAAEYLNGVFSVFISACACTLFALDIPVSHAAAILAIVHLAVLALGAYSLARQRGLALDLAYLVALVAGLNGYIVIWGAMLWPPALLSFAWLPWVWWGLERACRGRRGSVALAGVFLSLLISAGWPFSVAMVGMLSGWLVLKRWREPRGLEDSPAGLRTTLGIVALVWLVGLGLSAPAWLMLLEFVPYTIRGQVSWFRLAHGLEVPIAALPGLLFPALVTSWNLFEGWKPHLSAELAGGFVPLVILIAARTWLGWRPFKKVHWEASLLLVVLLLTLFPGAGTLRWTMRWLPLFFLLLGLVAAHVLDELRQARDQRLNLGVWATSLILPCWLFALAVGRDPTHFTWSFGLLSVGLCCGWAAGERWLADTSPIRRWLGVGVAWLSVMFLFASARPFLEAQTWSAEGVLANEPRLDPARRYFSVHTWEDIVTADESALVDSRRGVHAGLCPGNLAAYRGLHFVNGFSAHQPLGLSEIFHFEIHGTLPPDAAENLLRHDTGPDALLALLGVDGLIVANRFGAFEPILQANGWDHVATVPGGRVYQRAPIPEVAFRLERVERSHDRAHIVERLKARPAPTMPLLLQRAEGSTPADPYSFAPIEIRETSAARNAVSLDVRNPDKDKEALVVFRRPWFPGYRARLDGRPLPVETLNLVLPAVRVPAGAEGRLVLEYRPTSLIVGVWIFVATLAGIVTARATRLCRSCRR